MAIMTEQEVWDLVIKNRALLRSLVKKRLPRHRYAELEDLYSDVVLMRAHAILRNYREDGGASPLTFLCRNVEWYAFEKILDRKYKKRVTATSLDAAVTDASTSRVPNASGSHAGGLASPGAVSSTVVEVWSLLERLPPLARDVLTWIHVKGYDHCEIAKHLGVRRKESLEIIEWANAVARDAHDEVTRKVDAQGTTQHASYGGKRDD